MDQIDRLPIVDMTPLGHDPAAEAAIARELDDIFSTLGFCYFANIGVDPALTQAVFDASRRFHAQPMEAKQAVRINDFHRGLHGAQDVADRHVLGGEGHAAEFQRVLHGHA